MKENSLHWQSFSGTATVKVITALLSVTILHLSARAQTPGGIGGNLSTWFKANTVTTNVLPNNNTNTAVSDWKSESGTVILSQATSTKRPTFQTTNTATGNFNFNPFFQFNTTAITTLSTSSITPDLLGTQGTFFLVVNTNPGTSTNPTAFTYMSSTSYRYQVKPGFRIQTGSNGVGYTADFQASLLPNTTPPASAYLLTAKGTGTVFRGRKNADSIPLTHVNDAVYNPSITTGLYLGSNNNSEPYNGGVAELITYNTLLPDASINKIESYLAVKYGLTLSQQSAYGPLNANYTAADGTVYWNAAANTGYNKCITGIGRDDASALQQKQSRSVHDSSLVYVYHGATSGNFPASNAANTNAIATDNSFLLLGDNGQSRSLISCLFAGKMSRMSRVWKVQKTGTITTVTIALNQSETDAAVKNLLVSADPTFPDGATAFYPLQTANGKLYATLVLNSNDYFTFAADSLKVQLTATQPTCLLPAGGSVAAVVSNGVAPYSYSWNTTPVQTTPVATGIGGGAYTLSVSNTGGCTATYTTTLTTPSLSPVTISLSPTQLCAGDTVNISVNNPAGTTTTATWNWNGGIVQSGTGFGPFNVTYTNNATISVSVTEGSCTVTAVPRAITVIPLPVAGFSAGKTAGCPDLAVQFTNQSTQADSYKWIWGDGNESTGESPLHIYQQEGTYTVTLIATAQGQCHDTLIESDLITLKTPPTAFFSSTPGVDVPVELSLNNFVFINGSQNAVSYTWHWGDGQTSSLNNASHHYSYPGRYEVMLIAKNDVQCADTFTLSYYVVLPDKILQVPNAFSPNHDGINDTWEIEGLRGYPGCQVEIFNRWGQTVFSSRGYNTGWNGQYHGSDVPAGTYYYVIKTLPGKKPYSGWVALLR